MAANASFVKEQDFQSPTTGIPLGNAVGCSRHGALWNRVALSVAEVVVQLSSQIHGGVQVTTRHTIGPTQVAA